MQCPDRESLVEAQCVRMPNHDHKIGWMCTEADVTRDLCDTQSPLIQHAILSPPHPAALPPMNNQMQLIN